MTVDEMPVGVMTVDEMTGVQNFLLIAAKKVEEEEKKMFFETISSITILSGCQRNLFRLLEKKTFFQRRDNQLEDTRQNDTKRKDSFCDTELNIFIAVPLCRMSSRNFKVSLS